MQGIYTYIPETNHVPREYSVSAILSLFMVSISLVPALALFYFYISTFRSMCAVPNMAVFCSSLLLLLLLLFLTVKHRFFVLSCFYTSETSNVLTAIVTVPHLSSALCILLQKLWMEVTLHMDNLLYPLHIPHSTQELNMAF